MRNLSILSHRAIPLASDSPLRIEATTTDLDDGSIYAIATSRTSSTAADVTLRFLRASEDGAAFAQFNSLLVPGRLPPLPGSSTAVASTSGRSARDVIDFHYLSDGVRKLVASQHSVPSQPRVTCSCCPSPTDTTCKMRHLKQSLRW